MKDTLLRVHWHTPKQAEAFDRRVHNVKPECGLGWIPYTILVRADGGAIPHSAFHKARELRRWLSVNDYKLVLTGRFLGSGIGNRSGKIYQIER